jgi:hypothetical protein
LKLGVQVNEDFVSELVFNARLTAMNRGAVARIMIGLFL